MQEQLLALKPPPTAIDWLLPAIVVAALVTWVTVNFLLYNPPVGHGAVRLGAPLRARLPPVRDRALKVVTSSRLAALSLVVR